MELIRDRRSVLADIPFAGALIGVTLILVLSGGSAAFARGPSAHGTPSAAPNAAVTSSFTPSAPRPALANLAGVWTTDSGDTFEVDQAAGATSIDSKLLNDTCTWGQRSYVLKGTLGGDAFNGTSEQCSSKNNSLVLNCSLAAIWETPFFSNVSDDQIVGQYYGEYWTWDVAANGTWENCTLDHHYWGDFTFERLDCAVLTFDQLAVRYASDVTDVATAVSLATSFESGQKLAWTDAQQTPGGFKDKVTLFQHALASYGYSSTINSAYRPVLYQAHFANLRLCNLQMEHEAINDPGRAQFLAPSVAKVNAEVDKHGIKSTVDTIAGIQFKIPFICYREPLTGCPHVNERAVDMSVPGNPSVDWLGALYGFCRPYVGPDPPHWEYIGADPWGNPKCQAAGVGPGNADIHISGKSPINLLVTDAAGDRIGFDPASGSVVNDFGSGAAYYSGPGTHPQVIDLPGELATPGNYSITGVGTGNGAYTISVDAVDASGEVLESENTTGTAATDQPIGAVPFALQSDYTPPTLWTEGQQTSSDASGTTFSIVAAGSSYAVRVSGLLGTHVMFSTVGKAVAVQSDGASGSVTIGVPSGLLSGNVTVRADGASVPFTTAKSGESNLYTFDRPAGATVLTIEGTQVLTGGASTSAPFLSGAALQLLLIGAIVVVIAVVALIYRRRPPRLPAPPPPPPPPT